MELFITILQLICGLIVIGIVLFQSGKSAGLSGAIGGVADSFMAKNKAKSMDAKLARATKWVGAAFIVLTLVLNMLGFFAHIRRFVIKRAAEASLRQLFFSVSRDPLELVGTDVELSRLRLDALLPKELL